MFGWLTLLLGFEPTKGPPRLDSPTPKTRFESSLEMKLWPEGSQLRKHIRFREPDGWAHSNWAWRSNRYIDHPGSLHPKIDKAESHRCLGVLKCEACGNIVRPSTKTADMSSQLARNCLECAGRLLEVMCEARTYHFVTEEDGLQYSIWQHSGTHSSHPHPPAGRRPPRSVPIPQVARIHRNSQDTSPDASILAPKLNAMSMVARGSFYHLV
jgi:hypothetical protein